MNLTNWFVEKTWIKDKGYSYQKEVTAMRPNIPAIVTHTLAGILTLTILFGSVYTVEEGHVGIVKRFSEAKTQVDPGLHFKVPIIDSVEPMEIRTRKNVETLAAATSEQMPITAVVSVNWTVDEASALALYKKYGGLQQFENRILDPRLRSAAKTALPKYKAEGLIKERQAAIGSIQTYLTTSMEGFNVSLDSVQIENIGLPPAYLKSIETKQTAKNLADAEQFNLDKQALEAQRDVNVKTATAAGIKAVSIEKAAAIQREGLAEAAAIKAKAAALRDNPLIVQLTHEQRWNGSLLTTSFGGQGVIVDANSLIK